MIREAFPATPQMSSSQAPWDGLRVERHRLPSFKAPEVTLLEPFLTITVEGDSGVDLRREGRTDHLAMGPGSVCVLGAGPVPPTHVGGPVTSLFISVRPWMLAQSASDLLSLEEPRLRNAYGVRDPHFFHIGMALSAEIEQGYPGGRLYGESLATALITHLLAGYSDRGLPADSYKGAIAPRRLRLVLDHIEENLACDLSLAELAVVAAMSPCRFARAFRESMGLPPHQFVLRKRIARARALLEAGSAPLSEISASLGFDSQSHFTDVFRKLVGTTPAAYRAQQRH